MHTVGLEEVKTNNLTTDGKYFEVKYKFIEGNHELSTVKQYAGVTKDLHIVLRDNPLDGESKVARFLSTLSGILPQLKQYYHNYDAAVNNCVPYYKQEDLQYTNPIGLRVWKARHKDCTVAMKFTRTYGQIVHDFLANKGMAPKLMSINELEGGWKVIEMEFVEGETLQECLNDLSDRQKKCIKERLKSVLSTMNTQQFNFVHGDLRLPNIMIRKEELTQNIESPTPIFVDFDWAGTQGQATYPSSL